MRGEIDLVAVEGDTTTGVVQDAQPLGHFLLVSPQQLARLGLEGHDLVVWRRDEHDAVVDEQRRLVAGIDAGGECPHRGQLLHVVGVDLIERAVRPALVVAAGHQPVGRFRLGEPLVGDGPIAHDPLGVGQHRHERDREYRDEDYEPSNHPHSLVLLMETARPLRRAARPPPLGRLTSDTSGEPTGGDDATIDRPERQHGQASRGRPVDDARAIGRIESRRVARAEKRLGVLVPHRDGTPFVRTHGGVRNDATRGLRPGVRAELRGIEPDQSHLIQQGSVADDLRHRIHREGELLRTAERQILRSDHLAGALTDGEDEPIALARPSGLVVLGGKDVDRP